uniref:MDM2 binding protein n=1 Tax=Astyanax mexicanus TaxID=7994 RepID=W5LGW1_ASTMX
SRRIYDKLVEISSSSSSSELPPFPACSLSGSPGLQKCYFAVQMTYGLAQFCSAEWEEVCVERSDSEETAPSAVDSCISAVQDQEESESTTLTELFEEAAEALHQLADKLPPPGHFLLDVLMLCEDKEGLKEFLPVIGALKHMQAWHSALVNIVTEHSTGWRTAASYLSARVRSPAEALDCIDERELWRGGLWLRERKFVSELVFEGFSLKVQSRSSWSRVLNPERLVFHYYQPVMELIQLVNVADFPMLLQSSTEFELTMSSRSARARLFYDQLRTLRGGMGALFALSCVISTEAFPPASQLSASRWRDFMSKRPKVLSVPEVELKGEKGHYLLLVQGVESGGCKARLMHSANQINGTVALGMINGLIRETLLSSSGDAWLQSLPRLHGEQLLHREKGVDRVQMRVLQEWLRRREEVQKPAALPLNELKVLLNLAREQYLNTQNTTLPRVSDSEPAEPKHTRLTQTAMKNTSSSDWPERSVLRNYENMQKIRHRSRSSLFSGGSSDSLMGPKDGPKSGSAQLDARELLRHFTPDGLPAGELQPLPVLRGENAFQMSSDITPRKVTKLPFTQASSSHYHAPLCSTSITTSAHLQHHSAHLHSPLCSPPSPLCSPPSPLCSPPSPSPLCSPPSPLCSPPSSSLLCSPPSPLCSPPSPLCSPPAPLCSTSITTCSPPSPLCSPPSPLCSPPSPLCSPPSPLCSPPSPLCSPPSSSPLCSPPSPLSSPPSPSPLCSPSSPLCSPHHHSMLKEVVLKTLKHHGISSDHKCFQTCSRRLFDVSKLYLKDLKTSRGLHEEMKKAAGRNAKQVIDWVMEKDGL